MNFSLDELVIRPETRADHATVSELVREAFLGVEHSDHREHYLVERLRQSESFVPELTLVACAGERIVGFIMFTRVKIGPHSSLALAPVAVDRAMQGQGIGGALIREGHRLAAERGYGSAIVLGHKDYYPRFGYKPLSLWNIALPWDVPQEYCMAVEFTPGALDGVSGEVEYDMAFFE